MIDLIAFTIIVVCLWFSVPRSKSSKKPKKFGSGMLTDKPDSGNLNIWKY